MRAWTGLSGAITWPARPVQRVVGVMLERGWLVRLPDTRAVRLTVRGGEAQYRAVGFVGVHTS